MLCGQCLLKCPVAAIRDKSYIRTVDAALEDPERIVRCRSRRRCGRPWASCSACPGRFADPQTADRLRRIGFDYVFDTDFGADMAVMEEGHELVGRSRPAGRFRSSPVARRAG